MKIQKRHSKKNKLPILITAIVLAVLITGGSVFAYFSFIKPQTSQPSNSNDSKQDNTVDYQTPSDDQIEAGNGAKEDFIDKENSSETPKPSVGVSITSESQNANLYQIGTIVSTTNAEGKCLLTLATPNQTTITQEVGVQVYPNYATCKGFSIDTTNLYKGNWSVTIDYSDANSKGSVTKAIVIK